MFDLPAISTNVHVSNDMHVRTTLHNHDSFLALGITINDPTYSNIMFMIDANNVKWIHDLAEQLGQISQDLKRQAEEKASRAYLVESGFATINPESGALEPR